MAFTHPAQRLKPFRRATVIQLIGLLLLVFTCSYAFADRKTAVLFVASKSAADYVEVLNTVQGHLEARYPQGYEFKSKFRPSGKELASDLPGADFVVTIGTAAADIVFSVKPKVPVLSVLITENAFLALAEKYYGSAENAFASRVSSISLDQPVARSIELAKLLVPDARDIGLMLGPASLQRQPELERHIADMSLRPQFVSISAEDNPIHTIEPVLRRSDVFIPISDSRLINIATAKWILHLSYRYKVPVIAFSKSYLKAGALAAVYSSPADVAGDAAEWLKNPKSKSNGGLYVPAYYSLTFNESVAANLKIKLNAEQFYRDQFSQEIKQ